VTDLARLGLVYVAAAADGDVVGEELQGDDFEDGEEQLRGGWNVDGVLDLGGDLTVALDGDGDDTAGTRGALLNVAEGGRLNLEDFSVVRLNQTAPLPMAIP